MIEIQEPDNIKNYALVENGKVINVVIWNGESDLPYADKLVELTDNAGIDWDYKDGKFIDNRPTLSIPK